MKIELMLTALLMVAMISACSDEDPVEEEISTVTNEGPYGGHSVRWYKTHWKTETREQRRWCQRQEQDTSTVQSCIDATMGWKQGWRDPKTNPPRRWEDGPEVD